MRLKWLLNYPYDKFQDSRLWHMFNRDWKRSYSQLGEDMILRHILRKEHGFCVDIGAYHPGRLSNTYYFYQKGWMCLNVDPLPGVKKQFVKKRPRDITLELGVSDEPGNLTYFQFDRPAYNTFSETVAQHKIDRNKATLIRKTVVPVKTLEWVLDHYLPDNTTIDLLNVDVEGLELGVLKSNDFRKYSPTVICVESHNFDFSHPSENDIHIFLSNQNYQLITVCLASLIYQKS